MGTTNNHKGLVAVDIDGVIVRRTAVKRFDFENFEPITATIQKINTLYQNGYIIIYHTARPLRFYEVTYIWLIKNGCDFHALRMGKMAADYYIDDKNVDIESLLKTLKMI